MAIRERYVSAEEFWELAHLPENADKRMELIEGVVYEAPLSGFVAGVVTANLLGYMWTYVRANDLGSLISPGTGFTVHITPSGKDTVLVPDGSFIAKARLSAVESVGFGTGVPDLAVEVVSPNDKAAEIHAKVNKYLQYGARMVCVVYPATRTVEVHTPAGAQTLGEDDIFDGGDVLPGFTLPLRDIFA